MSSDCEMQIQEYGSPIALERDRLTGSPAVSFVGLALTVGVIIACYLGTFAHLIGRWSHEPDYSHGFLVPIISAWLLWQRRHMLRSASQSVKGRWLGVVLLFLSAVIRLFAFYFGFTLVEPVALIVCVAGVAAVVGGIPALRYAWPSIVFLVFMIPLPGALAGRLSGPLQHVATACSTYVLQTLGVPAIATGNVICLSHGRI